MQRFDSNAPLISVGVCSLTPGTHDVAVSFLNDAYAGTATTDRNLYVNAIVVLNGSCRSRPRADCIMYGERKDPLILWTICADCCKLATAGTTG